MLQGRKGANSIVTGCQWLQSRHHDDCWVPVDVVKDRPPKDNPGKKLRYKYVIITSKCRFDVIITYLLRTMFVGNIHEWKHWQNMNKQLVRECFVGK